MYEKRTKLQDNERRYKMEKKEIETRIIRLEDDIRKIKREVFQEIKTRTRGDPLVRISKKRG